MKKKKREERRTHLRLTSCLTCSQVTREDCEHCLQAIQRTGGNHKLKLDADLDMFLPEVVRRGIAEAVQRRSGGGGQAAIHEGPFATGDKDKDRDKRRMDSLPLVENLEYKDLFHGDTVADSSM